MIRTTCRKCGKPLNGPWSGCWNPTEEHFDCVTVMSMIIDHQADEIAKLNGQVELMMGRRKEIREMLDKVAV